MTRKELQDSVPEGWNFQNHNGRIHIKDENGNYRVRIDPPDKKLIILIYILWMKIKTL